MHAPNDNAAPKGLGRVAGISPKIRNATDELAMGVPPPASTGRRTGGWTMVFMALAAAQFSFAHWELTRARLFTTG